MPHVLLERLQRHQVGPVLKDAVEGVKQAAKVFVVLGIYSTDEIPIGSVARPFENVAFRNDVVPLIVFSSAEPFFLQPAPVEVLR